MLQAIQEFYKKHHTLLTDDPSSIGTLCLYGGGCGQGMEPVDIESVTWICESLNMLKELYLSNLRINHVFEENLRLSAVTKLVLHCGGGEGE